MYNAVYLIHRCNIFIDTLSHIAITVIALNSSRMILSGHTSSSLLFSSTISLRSGSAFWKPYSHSCMAKAASLRRTFRALRLCRLFQSVPQRGSAPIFVSGNISRRIVARHSNPAEDVPAPGRERTGSQSACLSMRITDDGAGTHRWPGGGRLRGGHKFFFECKACVMGVQWVYFLLTRSLPKLSTVPHALQRRTGLPVYTWSLDADRNVLSTRRCGAFRAPLPSNPVRTSLINRKKKECGLLQVLSVLHAFQHVCLCMS